MGISRRDFIGTAALGAVAAPLVSATGMPMRPLGITYLDTCDSYGANGESQLWMGKVLKQRGRKGLWLASKVGPRKYDDFMRMLDVSLKRLQVDHVDLLHI